MIIKVSKNNEVQYLQVLEGSKPLNAVVGMLLTAPRGTEFAVEVDRKSTRLNSSHSDRSRMPSSA